ncbi:MAG TPA: Spy/CpxP family protein refolding chaperone [Pyrinomonadaceae bacterium]|nr:Spy/CpxP family protein refolding chaperone [Pyrinomonadaceae bacterium]
MRNKFPAIAGIAVLVIGATALALGHGLQGMHGQGLHGRGEDRGNGPIGPGMIEHMTKALNLSSDQQTQIKALFEAAHTAAEPRHARLQELHKQLEAATANGQFDEAKVRAIANEQAQLMADQMVEHERMKSKVFGILNVEQRAKAEEMHRRGGPHGRRHGPPPPPPSE